MNLCNRCRMILALHLLMLFCIDLVPIELLLKLFISLWSLWTNGDRVSKNFKSCHICSIPLKKYLCKICKTWALSIYFRVVSDHSNSFCSTFESGFKNIFSDWEAVCHRWGAKSNFQSFKSSFILSIFIRIKWSMDRYRQVDSILKRND